MLNIIDGRRSMGLSGKAFHNFTAQSSYRGSATHFRFPSRRMKLILVFDSVTLANAYSRQQVLDAYYGCKWLPALLPMKCVMMTPYITAVAKNSHGQIMASEVLYNCDQLRSQMFPQSCQSTSHCMLVVTGSDLCLPGLSFVFGAANIRTAVAVVSLARLCGDLRVIRREMLHELGHCLGLGHCSRNCIMKYAKSLQDIWDRSGEPCQQCLYEMHYKLSTS